MASGPGGCLDSSGLPAFPGDHRNILTPNYTGKEGWKWLHFLCESSCRIYFSKWFFCQVPLLGIVETFRSLSYTPLQIISLWKPSNAPTSLLEAYLDSLSPNVTEYLEKNHLREDEVSMDSWPEGADHCVRDITATHHSASLVGKQRGVNTQPTLSFSAGPHSMDGAAHLWLPTSTAQSIFLHRDPQRLVSWARLDNTDRQPRALGEILISAPRVCFLSLPPVL